MLWSNRRGLGEHNCIGAVAGTAIVTSETSGNIIASSTLENILVNAVPRTVRAIYRLLGKFISVQLLTHWVLYRFAPSQQLQKKKKKEKERKTMTPAVCLLHLQQRRMAQKFLYIHGYISPKKLPKPYYLDETITVKAQVLAFYWFS